MSLNGQLDIKLQLSQQGASYSITQLDIHLSRANLAQKVTLGQSPQEAIKRISQIMSVCQHAQTTAAKLVLGEKISRENIAAVQYENIEQLFWRLVIDLAPLFNIEMPLAHFGKLTQATRKKDSKDNIILLANTLFQQLTHVSPQAFLAFKLADFQHWLTTSHSPIGQCLHAIVNQDKSKTLTKSPLIPQVPSDSFLFEVASSLTSEDTFIQTPHLGKQAYETGSFANIQAHPLAKEFAMFGLGGRFAARLLDLAIQINQLKNKTDISNNTLCGTFIEKQQQIAWVQTARGLLIHLANLQDNKVSQYSILAPTQWNFHPKGSLTKALVNTRYDDEQSAIKAVKLATIALDPCIEFNLQSTNLGVAYA